MTAAMNKTIVIAMATAKRLKTLLNICVSSRYLVYVLSFVSPCISILSIIPFACSFKNGVIGEFK